MARPIEPSERRSGRVTLREVAKRAGVSPTTVSFVLNRVDEGRIGADARERVLAAVEDLGYRHPRHGRPQPRSKTIGMLIDEIATSPMNALSIDGAQQAAIERGWLIVIGKTGGDPAVERAYLERWRAHAIDGILYSAIFTREVVVPPELGSFNVVLLNCHSADPTLASIVPGEVMGGYRATEVLIGAGHRRIGFINGEPWMEAARDRLAGYRQALADHDLPFDADLVVSGAFVPSGGRAAAHALMALPRPPSALFCASDFMALGAYEALKARGLRIPQDVAVMGYDDLDIAQHLDPPLSTIRLPHEEMGRLAVERLVDFDVAAEAHKRCKIACPLVLRHSV